MDSDLPDCQIKFSIKHNSLVPLAEHVEVKGLFSIIVFSQMWDTYVGIPIYCSPQLFTVEMHLFYLLGDDNVHQIKKSGMVVVGLPTPAELHYLVCTVN